MFRNLCTWILSEDCPVWQLQCASTNLHAQSKLKNENSCSGGDSTEDIWKRPTSSKVKSPVVTYFRPVINWRSLYKRDYLCKPKVLSSQTTLDKEGRHVAHRMSLSGSTKGASLLACCVKLMPVCQIHSLAKLSKFGLRKPLPNIVKLLKERTKTLVKTKILLKLIASNEHPAVQVRSECPPVVYGYEHPVRGPWCINLHAINLFIQRQCVGCMLQSQGNEHQPVSALFSNYEPQKSLVVIRPSNIEADLGRLRRKFIKKVCPDLSGF